MLLQWVKTAYSKNKTVLFLFVMMSLYEMINYFENPYILEHIALISRQHNEYSKHDRGNYSCPYKPSRKPDKHSNQLSLFYWTEQQKVTLHILQIYCPVFVYLFGGVCSDKIGGHRVLLVGFLLCAVVMSTLYLAIFNNSYIFLAMLVLRKLSQGIVWVAFFGLAGKLAVPNGRTMFTGILLTGKSFGQLLGYFVVIIIIDWRTICHISGLVAFFVAIWWWMIFKSAQFPKVRNCKHIPWGQITTSVSLYAICLLIVSCYLIYFISLRSETYVANVLFSKIDSDWVVRVIFFLTEMFAYIFCGASSDYIISREYLPASAVRKYFFSFSMISLFSTLVVVKIVRCYLMEVLGCLVVLRYAVCLALNTAMAVILDYAPTFPGSVIGIAFTFAIMLSFCIEFFLEDVFISEYSKRDINNWNGLFFTAGLLIFVFSLPFLCFVIRKPTWEIEAVATRFMTRGNIEMESTAPQHSE